MDAYKEKEEGFGIKELFLLGLGLMATLEEETKKKMDLLVKKGAEKEEKGRQYIQDIKGKEEAKNLEARIERALKRMVDIAGLATKEDVRRMEKKIVELMTKVEEKGGA